MNQQGEWKICQKKCKTNVFCGLNTKRIGEKEYCKKENGHLASITNIGIHNYFLSKLNRKLKDKETWFRVGGTDQEEEGNLTWSDGIRWIFDKWRFDRKNQSDNEGSRGEDCLQIYNVLVSHGWNDQACDTEIRFVCGCQLCWNDNNNDSSVTSNYTINHDSNQVNCTSNPMDKPIMKVAIASGALLLVVIY